MRLLFWFMFCGHALGVLTSERNDVFLFSSILTWALAGAVTFSLQEAGAIEQQGGRLLVVLHVGRIGFSSWHPVRLQLLT